MPIGAEPLSSFDNCQAQNFNEKNAIQRYDINPGYADLKRVRKGKRPENVLIFLEFEFFGFVYVGIADFKALD